MKQKTGGSNDESKEKGKGQKVKVRTRSLERDSIIALFN
jgi:hypothetical protein